MGAKAGNSGWAVGTLAAKPVAPHETRAFQKATGITDMEGESEALLQGNDNRVFNTPDGWKNANTDWMITAEDVWMYIGPGGVYSHSCEPGAHYSHWIAIYRGNGCDHNYVEVERVEATCETQGYILYCCELCGETAKDVIPYPGPATNRLPMR